MTSRRNGRDATAKGLKRDTLPATTVVTNIPAPRNKRRKLMPSFFYFLFHFFAVNLWACAHQTKLRQPARRCADERTLPWRWRCQELHYPKPETSHPQCRTQLKKTNSWRNLNEISWEEGTRKKDTATLWVRWRLEEMADRLGQKLRKKKVRKYKSSFIIKLQCYFPKEGAGWLKANCFLYGNPTNENSSPSYDFMWLLSSEYGRVYGSTWSTFCVWINRRVEEARFTMGEYLQLRCSQSKNHKQEKQPYTLWKSRGENNMTETQSETHKRDFWVWRVQTKCCTNTR